MRTSDRAGVGDADPRRRGGAGAAVRSERPAVGMGVLDDGRDGMRVTNKERRRIAGNLFEMYEDSLAMRRKFRAYAVAEKMGIELIDSAGYVPDWCIKRLVDLIDRPLRGFGGNPTSSYGICSGCGAFVRYDAATDCCGAVIPVRYCPNCGDELVKEERQ